MTAPQTTAAAVEQLARELTALARTGGLPDAGTAIEQEVGRAESGVARVVVVGEANRGKSSLVNALLGVSDLSPVAPDVATSCHIVVRAGERTGAILHRRDGGSEELALADIPDVATAAGSRSREAKAVEVTLDSPLLRRGISLIDTPGVGGLTAGHAEITRAALVEADAVLFVLDAESEIGAPEIAFLEQVSARVGTVIFTFGKIDDYPAWSSLLDSTRKRLPARFADRPIIGVSSERRRRATRAEAAGDAVRAKELFERSGFDALEAELERSVIARSRQLRLWNVLATCRGALEALEQQAGTVAAALDPAVALRLRQLNAEVTAFDQKTRTVAQEVVNDLETLRLSLLAEYERRTVELEREFRVLIAEWEDRFADEFTDRLQSRLDGLAGELNRQLLEGVAEVDRAVMDRFGVAGTELEFGEAESRLPLPQIASQIPDRPPSAKLRRTQLLLMGGLGGGRLAMLGSEAAAGIVATAAVGTLTGGLAIAGAVIGLTVATVANRRLDRGAGREVAKQQASRLVADALAEARIHLYTPLSNRIHLLKREFQTDVDERLRGRREELAAAQTEVRDINARNAAAAQQASLAAKERMERLRPLRQRLTGLWEDLESDAIV